jgi:glutathione S-transferase
MNLKLYFAPGACSFVPHTLLEASGVPFEPTLVKLHRGEQYGPEYKAINPRSQVPVLVQDGRIITQIVAICLHLDALFPERRFFPTDPMARTQALSTFAWMNNTVHPTFSHFFLPQKFVEQPDAQAAIKAFAVGVYRELLSELQGMVRASADRGDEWLAGADFGPLDAYALTLTRWGTMAGVALTEHPDLWAFVQRVAAHPPVARVIERERLKLDASPRS